MDGGARIAPVIVEENMIPRKDREIFRAVRMAKLPVWFLASAVSKITRFSSIKAACIMRGSKLFNRRKIVKNKHNPVRTCYYYSLAVDKI